MITIKTTQIINQLLFRIPAVSKSSRNTSTRNCWIFILYVFPVLGKLHLEISNLPSLFCRRMILRPILPFYHFSCSFACRWRRLKLMMKLQDLYQQRYVCLWQNSIDFDVEMNLINIESCLLFVAQVRWHSFHVHANYVKQFYETILK